MNCRPETWRLNTLLNSRAFLHIYDIIDDHYWSTLLSKKLPPRGARGDVMNGRARFALFARIARNALGFEDAAGCKGSKFYSNKLVELLIFVY